MAKQELFTLPVGVDAHVVLVTLFVGNERFDDECVKDARHDFHLSVKEHNQAAGRAGLRRSAPPCHFLPLHAAAGKAEILLGHKTRQHVLGKWGPTGTLDHLDGGGEEKSVGAAVSTPHAQDVECAFLLRG